MPPTGTPLPRLPLPLPTAAAAPPAQSLFGTVLAHMGSTLAPFPSEAAVATEAPQLFRPLPHDPQAWLQQAFASYFRNGQGQSVPMAPHHDAFWQWLWGLRPGVAAPTFVGIWSRGGAKSTLVELGAATVGYYGLRRYALYICASQTQADDHVSNVATALERLGVARAVSKYGYSRGWRVNRLRTQDGFTIDAVGMDAAMRGVRLEEARPDLLMLDDLDESDDTALTIKKKVATLTQKILPAGATNMAVVGVQNIPNEDGIFAQLADGRAGFLLDRILSGPYPALYGLPDNGWYAHAIDPEGVPYLRIVAGQPSWVGQGIRECEQLLTKIGVRAFLIECQHKVRSLETPGALWTQVMLDRTRIHANALPHLTRLVIALDPAGTSKETSDEMGIIAAGCDAHGHGYTLRDASQRGTPADCARIAIQLYDTLEADVLIGEANNGGEWIETVIRFVAAEMYRQGARPTATVHYKMVHASRNKQTRAEPIATECQQGRIHHVGYFPELESEQCHWVPGMPSPSRMDAEVWAYTELLLHAPRDPMILALRY